VTAAAQRVAPIAFANSWERRSVILPLALLEKVIGFSAQA
jgi:hypothetical protein